MSTLAVWTFFLALAAFIFSFSSYVVACKCWDLIDTILRAVRALHDEYNWDRFHGEGRENEK